MRLGKRFLDFCENKAIPTLFRKKPIIAVLQDRKSKDGLAKAFEFNSFFKTLLFVSNTFFSRLNWFDLIGIGLGNVIGAGIFVLTGYAAREKAGPAIVLSFLFGAISW